MASPPPPIVQFATLPSPQVQSVRTLVDGVSWAHAALERVLTTNAIPIESLIRILSGRCIETSTAFSGVMTPEIGDEHITAASRRLIDQHGSMLDAGDHLEPVKFTPLFAVEKDRCCMEEILGSPKPPLHCFQNVADFIEEKDKPLLGLPSGDGGKNTAAIGLKTTLTEMKQRVQSITAKSAAWCIKHGCNCNAGRASKHTAGSPCTDFSSFGRRGQLQGPMAPYFWAPQGTKLRMLFLGVVFETLERLLELLVSCLACHRHPCYCLSCLLCLTPV